MPEQMPLGYIANFYTRLHPNLKSVRKVLVFIHVSFRDMPGISGTDLKEEFSDTPRSTHAKLSGSDLNRLDVFADAAGIEPGGML